MIYYRFVPKATVLSWGDVIDSSRNPRINSGITQVLIYGSKKWWGRPISAVQLKKIGQNLPSHAIRRLENAGLIERSTKHG